MQRNAGEEYEIRDIEGGCVEYRVRGRESVRSDQRREQNIPEQNLSKHREKKKKRKRKERYELDSKSNN